ncbi:hypothetical protein DOTSEDRAFT_70604 [Dothistroma septosporum NZE10]|uniref:Arrestin-like N-terminal domain-containing protein n=1 Tax=Dothistroma septosporum (strain NZE10 / CBS 128990) TaxID=675120 RepID=N1PWR8_DOTSN|nr:hypothetical protein DOTSEDRAFT_70604 [Dothistroma septosporum NZE10]
MQASVILDQPGNVAYTNLDQISGRVIVRAAKSSDVSNILLKLEGESRTRLMSPAGPNGERPKPQVEYHKILYKVQMVFPPGEVAESRSHTSGKGAHYTLPAGQHEYPFSFKLPFNNSCDLSRNQMPMVVGLEVAKPAQRHVKKTLPPTLNGFPGEAEIRYFVKCTVNRHSIFKENARAYAPFNFFPIEPPRAPSTGTEVYARQKHHFDPYPDDHTVKDRTKGIFGKKSGAPNSPTTGGSTQGPAISVDARLPEPAILTCNSDIPLRLIVKRINDSAGAIFLQSLQVSLIGHTKIRAHEVFRTETNSWIVMSKSNMGIALGLPNDSTNTETVLDDRMWRGQSLPNTVAPGFESCNIDRFYQLDIRIGLSYAGDGSKVRPGQMRKIPQNIVLPLRLDTAVYSGIAPPPEVLARMAEARQRKGEDPMASKLRTEGRLDSDFGANQIPPTPTEAEGSSAPQFIARPGVASAEEIYGDVPPPSYEDAIASDLPPVVAPRPTYAPPPASEDPLLASDEKKG